MNLQLPVRGKRSSVSATLPTGAQNGTGIRVAHPCSELERMGVAIRWQQCAS